MIRNHQKSGFPNDWGRGVSSYGFGIYPARVSETGCKNWKSEEIFLGKAKNQKRSTVEKIRKIRGQEKIVKTRRKKRRKKKARTYIFNWLAPRWQDHDVTNDGSSDHSVFDYRSYRLRDDSPQSPWQGLQRGCVASPKSEEFSCRFSWWELVACRQKNLLITTFESKDNSSGFSSSNDESTWSWDTCLINHHWIFVFIK